MKEKYIAAYRALKAASEALNGRDYVSGLALVSGNAWVSHKASDALEELVPDGRDYVSGLALVSGNAWVSHKA